MFKYSDSEPFTGSPADIWKMDGTKVYLSHFHNLMFLNFMARRGTLLERMQAEKEIIICERKLKFWERHPNTVAADIIKGMEKEKKRWES